MLAMMSVIATSRLCGWSRTPVWALRQLARFRAVPQDRKQHLQSEYQFLPVFVIFNVNEMPGTIRSILGTRRRMLSRLLDAVTTAGPVMAAAVAFFRGWCFGR
jgi:hypothetical protein